MTSGRFSAPVAFMAVFRSAGFPYMGNVRETGGRY